MIKSTFFCALALTITCLLSCKSDPVADFCQLDLLSYGMPIVIKTPENPEINKLDLVFMKDITVTKGADYSVQIFEADVSSRDISVIKTKLISEVKDNPYFSTILQNDPAGFIYENKVDSGYVNYGFRHIRLQGDKEYIFQQGLRGKFSRESVQAMYASVQ